jgi:hypothetical protein
MSYLKEILEHEQCEIDNCSCNIIRSCENCRGRIDRQEFLDKAWEEYYSLVGDDE